MKKILFSLILLLIGSYQIAYSNKPAVQASAFFVDNSSEKEAYSSLEKEINEKFGILKTFFTKQVSQLVKEMIQDDINRFLDYESDPFYDSREENEKSSALKSFLKRTLESGQYNISVNPYAAQTKPTKNLAKAEAQALQDQVLVKKLKQQTLQIFLQQIMLEMEKGKTGKLLEKAQKKVKQEQPKLLQQIMLEMDEEKIGSLLEKVRVYQQEVKDYAKINKQILKEVQEKQKKEQQKPATTNTKPATTNNAKIDKEKIGKKEQEKKLAEALKLFEKNEKKTTSYTRGTNRTKIHDSFFKKQKKQSTSIKKKQFRK